MNRLLIHSIIVTGLLTVGAATAVSAQEDSAASADTSTTAPSHHHHDRQAMSVWHDASPEERAVLKSLAELERVYLGQGRIADLHALLIDIKGRTSNTAVNAVIDRQLERSAHRPTNPDQRIATLTQVLNANLAKLP